MKNCATMESGKFNTCKAPYGFTLHEGKLSIKEDEAAVVQCIFQLYLNGLNGYEIANTLSQQEIPPGREMGTWKDSSIYYILKNERYAGKAMVGKSYSTTTFPHKKVRNQGEREMYLLLSGKAERHLHDLWARQPLVRTVHL